MPQAHDFYCLWLVLDSIVQVVVDAAQMNTAYAGEFDVCGGGSDVRMSRNELEGARDRVTKRVGGSWPIHVPPCRSHTDLPGGTAGDA